ncbi:MAG: ribosome small subunit-dependent GTPase A [Thermodesulfobacteriota bacterium]
MARDLATLGWDPFFAEQLRDDAGAGPARVVAEQRGAYRILGADDVESWAAVPGRLRREAGSLGMPAVGDWVLARRHAGAARATIERVLDRRSAFTRRAAGQDAPQVVAANVDVVLIVTSMNRDFNPRRLERYLTLAWNSGATPAIVLSKADLCTEQQQVVADVAAVAPDVPVHVASARDGRGLAELEAYVRPGRTAVLLGSSGVGKSTLVNALAGRELQAVADTLADDRGRHTTTSRQLLFLPSGGMIIDTPGMREVGLVGDEEGLERAFGDVTAIAARCRFSDCRHDTEPGCAVVAALASGELPPERWESYAKLQRELAFQATLADQDEARRAKARGKRLQRDLRALYHSRRR